MKKHIYKMENINFLSKLIEVVDSKPECGEDFCDSCGDCLHCNGGDECLGSVSGKHFWVEYREEE